FFLLSFIYSVSACLRSIQTVFSDSRSLKKFSNKAHFSFLFPLPFILLLFFCFALGGEDKHPVASKKTLRYTTSYDQNFYRRSCHRHACSYHLLLLYFRP